MTTGVWEPWEVPNPSLDEARALLEQVARVAAPVIFAAGVQAGREAAAKDIAQALEATCDASCSTVQACDYRDAAEVAREVARGAAQDTPPSFEAVTPAARKLAAVATSGAIKSKDGSVELEDGRDTQEGGTDG